MKYSCSRLSARQQKNVVCLLSLSLLSLSLLSLSLLLIRRKTLKTIPTPSPFTTAAFVF